MDRVLGWGAICALVLALGCTRPATVKIDGSDTVYPITEAVAEEFQKEHPNVRVAAGFAGTGGGFKKFSNGELDISDASRQITDSEREACKKNGIEFVEFTIAFDGIAVVTNPQNNWVDCLTVDQLNSIWQPDSNVSKWSDVKAGWPDEKIKLYGPTYDNGTFDYFTEKICGEKAKSRQDYSASVDYNVVATGVAGDKYSLGYFGMAYYEANREKVKLMGVEVPGGKCVTPSLETVRDKTYQPLSRPLFIYVRKSSLSKPEVREFVKFYLEHVNKLVSVVGYVPTPDETPSDNLDLFEETLKSLSPTK